MSSVRNTKLGRRTVIKGTLLAAGASAGSPRATAQVPASSAKAGAIGTPMSRTDGALKVTGRAPYAIEHAQENLAYAVTIMSTIAAGRIVSIDTDAANTKSSDA